MFCHWSTLCATLNTYCRFWMLGTMHLWGTLTIFGHPVVPEVWTVYAILHSSWLQVSSIDDEFSVSSFSQSAMLYPWRDISLWNLQWPCCTPDSQKIQCTLKSLSIFKFLSWLLGFKYVNAEPLWRILQTKVNDPLSIFQQKLIFTS